jgi:hypothetical protein
MLHVDKERQTDLVEVEVPDGDRKALVFLTIIVLESVMTKIFDTILNIAL